MKIGVVPHSKEFDHPGDRRRYKYVLNKIGASYDYADFKNFYDVVYITIAADITLWKDYKRNMINGSKSFVVFDLCDGLLSMSLAQNILKPFYYKVTKKHKRYQMLYSNSLKEMIANADAVVCGSVEQASVISQFNRNTIIIRDSFWGELENPKNNYHLHEEGELHVFWEGFSHGNKACFELLKDILIRFNKDQKVHLHVVTDPQYCAVGGKYLCKPTINILEKLFKHTEITYNHYDWSIKNIRTVVQKCDIALIPIPKNPVMRQKPENKLIFMWLLGIPVITSDSPSYVRTMSECGIDYSSKSSEEWVRNLNILSSELSKRDEYMRKVRNYLKKNVDELSLLESWKKVFTGSTLESFFR